MNHFCEWIDEQDPISDRLLPLTHTANAVRSQKIVDSEIIDLPKNTDGTFKDPQIYFFYGRPAYRTNKDKSINTEASAPCCFIFKPEILKKCRDIYAFDTGAFFARMYSHILIDDFEIDDFYLGGESDRINKLISGTFMNEEGYIFADKAQLRDCEDAAQAYHLAGRAYLVLLASRGRNEPDDRLSTIEVNFDESVSLMDGLEGVVVPSSLWSAESKAPFLARLSQRGVNISCYRFIVGRHPEYFQAQLELSVNAMLKNLGYFNND